MRVGRRRAIGLCAEEVGPLQLMVRRLVPAGALGFTCLLVAAPAHALAPGWSPEAVCGAERFSLRIEEENTKLVSPEEGASVLVGSALTLSAESGQPLTFEVASSPELLSQANLDQGPGVAGGAGAFTFASTKATADQGTVYWAVAFTQTLRGCEVPPVTYTTPARKLTVVPPPSSPDGIPRHVKTVLLRQAHSSSRRWGDSHPKDIEAVLTIHEEADRIQDLLESGRRELPAQAAVYLVAMRGHFWDKATNVTARQCALGATLQVSPRFNPKRGGYEVATLVGRYPDLNALGAPVRLGVRGDG